MYLAIEQLVILDFFGQTIDNIIINKELTTDPQKNQKRIRLRKNLQRFHIIYLTIKRFNNIPKHKINILEKSHKLITIILYKYRGT